VVGWRIMGIVDPGMRIVGKYCREYAEREGGRNQNGLESLGVFIACSDLQWQ